MAVHVFCYVIIKLAIAHRAFSSWCPPCPPRLFPASSSTLNRIKVAEEKQAGINRAEERRAPPEIRRRLSPFLLAQVAQVGKKETGRKTTKKHMHSSVASVSSRSRCAVVEWVAEGRCNEAIRWWMQRDASLLPALPITSFLLPSPFLQCYRFHIEVFFVSQSIFLFLLETIFYSAN